MQLQWTATRWSHYSDQYTFKSSNGHFLFPDVSEGDLPGNGTALIGHEAESAPFTVRKVPGTQLYKCEVFRQTAGYQMLIRTMLGFSSILRPLLIMFVDWRSISLSSMKHPTPLTVQ